MSVYLDQLKADLARLEEMLDSYAEGIEEYRSDGNFARRIPFSELQKMVDEKRSTIRRLEAASGAARILAIRSPR